MTHSTAGKAFIFLSVLVLVISFFGIFSNLAQAAIVNCGREGQAACTTCDIFVLISDIINFVVSKIVPAVATILFLFAGFMIIIGGASPKQVQTGKSVFRTTVWGLLIIYSSWLIANSVIKSLAGDNNVSNNWYKIECIEPVSTGVVPTPTPTTTVVVTGTCTGTSCGIDRLICGPDPSANCSRSAVNNWSSQITAGISGISVCSGIDTAKLVKAIMSQESGGVASATSSAGAYGLMQLKVDTANAYKSGCTTDNITADWLRNSNNARASICIATRYMASLANSGCGCSVRNIAAGYNGGGADLGACNASTNCANCTMCSGQSGATRRWECLWDSNDHQVCNVNRADGSFAETRAYAPKVEYCYSQF